MLTQLILILVIQSNKVASSSDEYESKLIDLTKQYENYPIDLSFTNTFAFWSFCIPAQQMGKFIEGNKQQLFYITDIKKTIIVMFVSFNMNQLKVEHEVWLAGSVISNQEFDPLQYEGIWILTMITITKKEITIQTLNANGITKKYTLEEELSDSSLSLGGAGLQVTKELQLGVFKGRISKLMQFYDSETYENIKNTQTIPAKVFGEQKKSLIDGLKIFQGDSLKFEMDQIGDNFCISAWVKYDASEANNYINYLLFRLTAYRSYADEIKIGDELVKIVVELDLQQPFNFGYQVASFHYAIPIEQVILNRESQKIYINNQEVYPKILVNWHFIAFEHARNKNPASRFIISYFLDQVETRLEYTLGNSRYRNLFINTKYYLLIGQDNVRYFQKLRGSIYDLQMAYNFDYSKEINFVCHYSCQECQGPTQNDCIKCFKDTNRIYLNDQNQCSCINGYLEIDKVCKSITEFQYALTLKEIDFDQNLLRCDFGYFALPEQSRCIKCPNEFTKNFDLNCAECLLNPTSWYNKLTCQKDLIIQAKSIYEYTYGIYQRSPENYELYLIDDDYNLQLVRNAETYCQPQEQNNCKEIKTFYLLSKKIYVNCKQNYFMNTLTFSCEILPKGCLIMDIQNGCQKCISGYQLQEFANQPHCIYVCKEFCIECNTEKCLTCISGYTPDNNYCIQCGKNCEICQFQHKEGLLRCLKCVDHKKYYLSINQVDCLENQISNCIYAFEATKDFMNNSFEFNGLPDTVSDSISGCARCMNGFQYDQETNECIVLNDNSCTHGYKSSKLKICFIGQQNVDYYTISFKMDCQYKVSNCQLCLLRQNMADPTFTCLTCQVGYYSERQSGYCIGCPQELNCSSCYQQQRLEKDYWKNEIQPFYRALIDDYKQSHSFIYYGTSQDPNDYEILCHDCLTGFELLNDICVKGCPKSCLECKIINNQYVCVNCPSNDKEQNYSIHENECILCPSNCELCRKREQQEIKSINPLFDNQDFWNFSNQCIGFYECFGMNQFTYSDCKKDAKLKLIEITLELECYGDNHILISDEINQFKSNEFYKLSNQFQIQTFIIKIISITQQTCNFNQIVTQSYSQNIFTAIDIQLEIYGNNITIFKYEKLLQFINFSKIKIVDVIFDIIGLNKKPILFESAFEQTIELNNIKIFRAYDTQQQTIIINNASRIFINNLKFNQINLNRDPGFIISFGETVSDQLIIISNFLIDYTSIAKQILFDFHFKETDQVEISNLEIFNCVLYQTSILNLKQGKLILSDSKFNNNYLFDIKNLIAIEGSANFYAKQLIFASNQIFNSSLIALSKFCSFSQIQFESNKLTNFSTLINNSQTSIQQIKLEQIRMQLNEYDDNSKFIDIKGDDKYQNQQLLMTEIELIGSKFIYDDIKKMIDQSLIQLQIENVSINKLNIERVYGHSEINFFGVKNLTLNSITIKHYYYEHEYEQLILANDCLFLLDQDFHYCTSIYLYDVSNIIISNLNISSAHSLNCPIIYIDSSQTVKEKTQILKLNELYFKRNYLLVLNNQKQTGLIQFISQLYYEIIITDSFFERNLLHQNQENLLQYQGLILNFDCPLCTIYSKGLRFQNNLVTNASTNIIQLRANKIQIENSTFESNCIFDYNHLYPYIKFNFEPYEKISLEILAEILQIKVSTANAILFAQQIIINQILINNSTSTGLQIKIENEANILIENSSFFNINSGFNKEEKANGGALFIDSSQATSVTINIKNVYAKNINNRNSGGFIYFLSGKGTTILNLNEIYVENVYSLEGSLFYGYSATLNAIETQFKLTNLKLKNSLQGQLQFLNQFKFNSSSQSVLQQLNSRTIIQISNFQNIDLINLQFSNVFYESILNLQAAKTLIIREVEILQSKFLNFALSLDQFIDNSSLFLNQLKLLNITVDNTIEAPSKCSINKTKNIKVPKFQCKILFASPQKIESEIDKNSLEQAYCVINALNQILYTTNVSLIYIKPQQTILRFSKMSFQNINCFSCQKGLIEIQTDEDNINAVIEHLLIMKSVCWYGSCMTLVNERNQSQNSRVLQNIKSDLEKKQYDFRITDYVCMSNKGYEGTCLRVVNLRILITQSIFKNNFANITGGSISIKGNQQFVIIESIISNNAAQYGGGVSINDQYTNQFYKSQTVITQNLAQKFGNDTAQLPSQLSISVDTQQVLPKIKIIENQNLIIEQIQIKPYEIFKNQFSDSLFLPNGQPLSSYKYFNIIERKQFKYNINFRIKALDQFNIIQQNLENSTCDVVGRILNEEIENNFTKNFTNMPKVNFSQSDYNLDDIIIQLDDQLNLTLQLQFNCSSIYVPIYNEKKEIINYHNNYYLRINVKAFPCQIGEIKNLTSNICVPCNSTEGWYSLNINSNQCSLKDDQTVLTVTSTSLNLKPGYWRPYFDNDKISECINLLQNCNGGWYEGDTSCTLGHIGALCEECDLYDSRGEGHYSTSNKYSCGPCADQQLNSILISAISLWALISVLISVKGTVALIEDMAQKIFLIWNSDQDVNKSFISSIYYNKLQIQITINFKQHYKFYSKSNSSSIIFT
ncbi:unnamed protein product [Paramecium sonneborni]|uniref:EGF-like domain-containing protein n=1 Tax=Paramecium sonneborni TaxID=65129 RepID=A0A8S1N2N3_9CILI|nr:unnamed protein product [Paramecium sonneborni]